jgi:hypothetical protein
MMPEERSRLFPAPWRADKTPGGYAIRDATDLWHAYATVQCGALKLTVKTMHLEDEEAWLRKRIIRLRTILRYANDPRVEDGLREFIADAEQRLELLQNRRVIVQQQQQIRPKKKTARSRAVIAQNLGAADN